MAMRAIYKGEFYRVGGTLYEVERAIADLDYKQFKKFLEPVQGQESTMTDEQYEWIMKTSVIWNDFSIYHKTL